MILILSSCDIIYQVYVVEHTLVTRWVPHVEQELHALHEHQNSPQVFSGVRDARLLVFCVMFCRSLFVLLSRFVLVIVLSPLLRLTTSDYLFGFEFATTLSVIFFIFILLHSNQFMLYFYTCMY
jgi:hypothetical protein